MWLLFFVLAVSGSAGFFCLVGSDECNIRFFKLSPLKRKMFMGAIFISIFVGFMGAALTLTGGIRFK